MRWKWSIFGALLALAACGDDDAVVDAATDAPAQDAQVDAGPPPDPPLVPDSFCPGGPTCPPGGDPTLFAGAARVDITPSPDDGEPFEDLNGNGSWDEGEPFDDRNGNGTRDAVWLAGFGMGRAATDVSDPQWASAVALRAGNTTLAFVSIDCVGWFLDEVDAIREALADADVDYVTVAATHVHQARDTIGIWGPSLTETGYDPEYQARVRDAAVAAVREALTALEPANIQYASLYLRDADEPSDVNRYVGDLRDPNIIDDEIRVLRFVAAGTASAEPGSGRTISTLVNFASHPEYLGSSNTLLSSDWPHWMREAIEEGITEGPGGAPVPPLGGITVYVNGAIGSQIGPNRLRPRGFDGAPIEGRRERTEAIGTQIGELVLRAVRGGGTVVEETATLGFRRARFFLRVANIRYYIAGENGLFQRSLHNYDTSRRISNRNAPDVLTEIAVIDVGRATMLSVPGELDPAEWVGGYEAPCEYTPGGCANLVDLGRENPPDLSRAPTGPFLRDWLGDKRPDATQRWVLGCTNDFLGYFIPEFDYELELGLPYLAEAPGSHYEETNSVSEDAWPRIRGKLHELIAWEPD
ncbi:MAG: hypothetical protein KF901_26135 [Myxococcales bacterium]|nr:hypothetical protein [Myxococcales bacterium]